MRNGLQKARRVFVGAARSDEGAGMIEYAIGFMLLWGMMLGIIECCMTVYAYSVCNDAVHVGVRYAQTHGTDSSNCSGPSCQPGQDTTCANIASTVTSYLSPYTNIANPVVSVYYDGSTTSCSGGASKPGSSVNVSLRYTYQSLFKFPAMTQHYAVSSQGRIVF